MWSLRMIVMEIMLNLYILPFLLDIYIMALEFKVSLGVPE